MGIGIFSVGIKSMGNLVLTGETMSIGNGILSLIFETTKATVLGNKIHTDKLDVLYTRGYSQLKGITESMEQQIAHVLSDGMLKGMSPEAVANEINDRVDKIGKTRAKLIARTEIVYSHNVASIMETARLEGILEKELEMIWHTSIDGRERDTHRARHGKKYSKEEALALIGEPHCRCSVSPWVPEAEESK
jgi:SPP1 gp7 family putative phage head morphogenesis protein